MLQLTTEALADKAAWRSADIALPRYNSKAMAARTLSAPTWVHFGAGNIFRGFLAAAQQDLLNAGSASTGIIAVESFDFQIIDQVYLPYDNLSLLVRMSADGVFQKEVIASVACALRADCGHDDWARLLDVFAAPSLQMVSFTITEKGYALTDLSGKLLQIVERDLDRGPHAPRHTMGVIAGLLFHRFQAGGVPIAVVSLDNCAQNGKRLRDAVLYIAGMWEKQGLVPRAFLEYLETEDTVSFPWSMIDKITPHPARQVQAHLEGLGLERMTISTTNTGTLIAPFVNTEVKEYLVLEDRFPNGRPPLEGAGVLFADRKTVELAEKMKVGACLNPLHTALAVFGCLLGFTSISDEMHDPDLKALVERLAFEEGLPAAEDPGILNPRRFIEEVLTARFPNPYIPDTPQRIAADTSQKLPVRFGGTLRRYQAQADLNLASLKLIPLVFAGWLRYLMAVDDKGAAMAVSPDPMAEALQEMLVPLCLSAPQRYAGQLRPILQNEAIFGIDLCAAGLAERVEQAFCAMLVSPGAVRSTLQAYLAP